MSSAIIRGTGGPLRVLLDELEVWFCLPTPAGEDPYKVRRPSLGRRYEFERFLQETRPPEG